MLQLPLVLVIRKDEVAVFMCFYLWLLFEHTRCLRAHLHFTLFYSIHYFLLYLICFSPHWISSMTLDFLSCVHRHDLFIYNFSSQVFCVRFVCFSKNVCFDFACYFLTLLKTFHTELFEMLTSTHVDQSYILNNFCSRFVLSIFDQTLSKIWENNCCQKLNSLFDQTHIIKFSL